MSETVRMWLEIVFNVAYLLTIWWLVSAMARRRTTVAPGDRAAAGLVMWAFALLALGDTGHVGFRVLAYALGDLKIGANLLWRSASLVGLGALATAFTVTIFYVLMLAVWRVRFDRRYGWFEYLLFAVAVARGVLMLFPANEWERAIPPQPWSTYRNLPLMLLGLGVAFLILRDAREARDRTFLWIGMMILVSYACYIPVIFFVQRVPNIGMLMIPKTMAYLVIGFLAYRELWEFQKNKPPK